MAAAAIVWAWPRPEGRWLREGGAWSRERRQRSVSESSRRAGGDWAKPARGSAERAQPARADIPVVALPPASAAAPNPGVTLQGGTPPPSLPADFAGLPRGTPAPAPQPSMPAAQGAPAPGGAAAVDAGGVIYSREDSPLVAPPTLVSPRMPTVPASGAAASAARRLKSWWRPRAKSSRSSLSRARRRRCPGCKSAPSRHGASSRRPGTASLSAIGFVSDCPISRHPRSGTAGTADPAIRSADLPVAV